MYLINSHFLHSLNSFVQSYKLNPRSRFFFKVFRILLERDLERKPPFTLKIKSCHLGFEYPYSKPCLFDSQDSSIGDSSSEEIEGSREDRSEATNIRVIPRHKEVALYTGVRESRAWLLTKGGLQWKAKGLSCLVSLFLRFANQVCKP